MSDRAAIAPDTTEVNSDSSAARKNASRGCWTDATGTRYSVSSMINPPAMNTPTNSRTGPIHDMNRMISGHSTALRTPNTNARISAAGSVGIGPMLDSSSSMPPRIRSSTRIANADDNHSTTNSTTTRSTPATVCIAPLSSSGIVRV